MLFDLTPIPRSDAREANGDPRGTTPGQWFTPAWAVELIIDNFFPDLCPDHFVLEPSADTGSFLRAIPDNVPAAGIEIDPDLATTAQRISDRPVIAGDFRTVPIEFEPTHIIGNPPFQADIVEAFLDRAYGLLPNHGHAAFILPAYYFQTPSRVLRHAKDWGIEQQLLPRTLFPRLRFPIVFAIFRKSRLGLQGFALYQETNDVAALASAYADILTKPRKRGSIWRQAVEQALESLGGTASLDAIYRAMESARPSANRFWHEKVRQVLQKDPFERLTRGRYALAS